MWVFVVAVAAALLFAVGSVTQQRTAAHAPPEDALSFRLLWWLLHQRRWLVGIGVSVVGNLLAATAIGAGGVALVQPLFTVRLPFALVLSASLSRLRVPRRDAWSAVAATAGLAVFIAAGHPHKGHPLAATGDEWLTVAVVLAVIVAALVAAARRLDPAREATLLGTAAGILFWLQSSLTETAIALLRAHGAAGLFRTWPAYLLIVCAIVGALLIQSAYQMAPLPASFPAVVSTEPLTGLGVGVGILGGTLRLAPLPLAVGIAGLVAMCAGVVLLAGSPIVTGQLDLLQRRREEGIAYRVAARLEHRLGELQVAADRLHADLAQGGRVAAGFAHRLADADSCLVELRELTVDMSRHKTAEHEHLRGLPARARMQLAVLERELDDRQRDIEAHIERLGAHLRDIRLRAELTG